MSIFNLISENELEKIDSYIDRYAIPEGVTRTASVEKILQEWDRRKSKDLIKLMENNLILERDIRTSIPRWEIEDKVCLLMEDYRETLITPIREMVSKSCDSFYTMFGYEALSANKIFTSRVTPVDIYKDGEVIAVIKVMPGSKAIKCLGKIAKLMGLGEIFEEFRIKHSIILNTKQFHGTLCLSIHPLDYMTMSDNDNNWSSCMSWRKHGCYRQGTVEMMNSQYVIVAYLKGKQDMHLLKEEDDFDLWNNKKWRELFIVSQDCILNIKSYPYVSEELTTTSLQWIKELATKNLGWIYTPNYNLWHSYYNNLSGVPMDFKTTYMYNDIKNDDEYDRYVYLGVVATNIDINYSGEFVCMACGEIEDIEDEEGTLLCSRCDEKYYCEKCGEYFRDLSSMHRLHGGCYCRHCYRRLREDPITNEKIGSCDEMELYLVQKNSQNKIKELSHIILDDNHFTSPNEFEKLEKYFSAIRQDYYKPLDYNRTTPLFVYPEDLTPEGEKLFFIHEEIDSDWDSWWYSRFIEANRYPITNTVVKNEYFAYCFSVEANRRTMIIMKP